MKLILIFFALLYACAVEAAAELSPHEKELREKVDSAKKTHGPASGETWQALANLTYFLHKEERWPDVEKVLRETHLLHFQRDGHDKSEEAMTTKMLLGMALIHQWKHVQAEALFDECVVAARRHFPNEREEEAYAIAGKGKALEGQGYYEEAAESFEKALIIAEKAGAPQHDVVVALGNLARVHQLQKNKKKAANTYRRLIAFMNKVKATRGNAIFMCSYFAKSYIALDQPDRAELFIQRNLELEKAATGMVSPDAMRLQGRVLLGLKKFDESNAAFEAAIDKLAEEKNLWRPERSLFHLEYAESLLQQGKLPEAKKQAEQALKIQRKLLREDHPLIKEASAILSKTDAKRSSPKSE